MQYGGRRSSSSSQFFPDLLLLLTFTTSLLQTPSLWCSYPAIDIKSCFCFPVTVKLIVHASELIYKWEMQLFSGTGLATKNQNGRQIPSPKQKSRQKSIIQYKRQSAEVISYRGPIMRLGKVTCLGKKDSQNDPPTTEALLRFV